MTFELRGGFFLVDAAHTIDSGRLLPLSIQTARSRLLSAPSTLSVFDAFPYRRAEPRWRVADVPAVTGPSLSGLIMTKTFSLLGFVAELGTIERDIAASGPMIVEKACRMVQARAKRTVGSNQAEWPPLSPSTIADKQKHGFKTPAPLLRTGEMRDSIEYTVHGLEGCVGSDSPIALFQEMGTSRIPPRSFLRSAAIASEDKIRRMAVAATVAVFSGHGRHARDIRELLHLLHLAGHAVRELGEDLLEPDEETDR